MQAITLTPDQLAAIAALTGEWEIIAYAGTRQLVDGIVDPTDIPTIQNLLSAYSPIIDGAWNQDGSQYGGSTPVYPFNSTDYSSFVPLVGGKPVFTHGFSGWSNRTV